MFDLDFDPAAMDYPSPREDCSPSDWPTNSFPIVAPAALDTAPLAYQALLDTANQHTLTSFTSYVDASPPPVDDRHRTLTQAAMLFNEGWSPCVLSRSKSSTNPSGTDLSMNSFESVALPRYQYEQYTRSLFDDDFLFNDADIPLPAVADDPGSSLPDYPPLGFDPAHRLPPTPVAPVQVTASSPREDVSTRKVYKGDGWAHGRAKPVRKKDPPVDKPTPTAKQLSNRASAEKSRLKKLATVTKLEEEVKEANERTRLALERIARLEGQLWFAGIVPME